MKFTCQRSGNCCSHPKMFITLTYQDLVPLLSATKTLEKFLESISFLRIENSLPANEKEQLLKQLVITPLKATEGEVIPVLRKHSSNECIFYSSSTHTCEIYPHRPLACQMFPIGLPEISEQAKISWNALAKNICPGLNKGNELSPDYLQNIIDRAWKYITDTNNKIKIINMETTKKGRSIKSKEALLTLLLLSEQFYKEQDQREKD